MPSETGSAADTGLDVQPDVNNDASAPPAAEASVDAEAGPGRDGGDGGCFAAGTCADFPPAAVTDDAGTPVPNGASLFSSTPDPTAGNAPCLLEPADGSLYPYNWLRPRVYWAAGSGQKYFEVRFHSDGEANDYVVYTSDTYWTMDKATWEAIAGVQTVGPGPLADHDIVVTVRGSSGSGNPSAPATATFHIAPAVAAGSLIYWTTASYDNSATSTTLNGFTVGDEGVTVALKSTQVQQPVRAVPLLTGGGTGNLTTTMVQDWCIGCHTATPDGNNVEFTSQWPWANAVANVSTTSGLAVGATPNWMSATAEWLLSPDIGGSQYGGPAWAPAAVDQVQMGISTFSPAHYTTGDHILISQIGAAWNAYALGDLGFATGVTSQLVWVNLEYENGYPDAGLPMAPCTSTPTIPNNNDPGGNGNPPQACSTTAGSGGGWGTIARTGDTNSAGAPSWSFDGLNIAYGSTDYGTKDGRMDCGHMAMTGNTATSCVSDIRIVPYNSKGAGLGGAGGTSTALPGASDTAYNEYYPAWSPDDKILAFNRVAANHSMYNTTEAEVYVVQYNGGQGGTAVRLKANDPVQCSGLTSPGVQNTWPKWAPNPSGTRLADGGVAAGSGPAPQYIDGLTYYWITFSSIRSPTTSAKQQQLYVAGITMDDNGNITTYAPIYLWNQDYTVNNLIPSWGTFALPAPTQGAQPPPPAHIYY
jgi:hypothetical protein